MEKKERKVTAKGFLTKCNSSKAATSAIAFIAAHREYLLTGEVSAKTATIVNEYDSGNMLASVAIEEIKQAVFHHVLEQDNAKALASLNKAPKTIKSDKVKNCSTVAATHNFEAKIIDAATGEVCLHEVEVAYTENDVVKYKKVMKPLVKRFLMPQDAERWVDRRLFDGAPSWYGKVLYFDSQWDIIERGDSIARILKKPRGAICQHKSTSTSKLGFGVKVKETAIRFSRG